MRGSHNPIPVRHPFVFYEGHLAAFGVNTLVKGALGRPGVDAMLERLFERGIDPKDEGEGATFAWPTRARVADYVRRAEAAIEDAITTVVRDAPRNPQPERNEALHAIVEHELMHQETLLYMLRELPTAAKRRPADLEALQVGGTPPAPRSVAIPAGRATLGLDRESGDVRLGQRISPDRERRPRLRDRRLSRHERGLSGVRGRGRVSRGVLLGRERLQLDPRRRHHASARVGEARGRLVVSRAVRGRAAASGLARLGLAGGSRRVRALPRPPASDGGRVASCGFRAARRAREYGAVG